MRIAGSNRYFVNPSEKKTLSRMAKNVEEGGNSEDDSLEEITAEDFSHDARGSRSRVWIPDPMRYPISRNLASQLYSFAWAQAVQNKPLGFDVKLAVDPSEKTAGPNTVKEEPCGVVIEDSSEELGGESEKEEGELEEGEIELDSEPMEVGMVGPSSDKSEMGLQEEESADEEPAEMGDFDKRVSLILEELEAVTGEEAETSFDAVCSRLRKSFESLKEMFSESHVPVLDALVQQAFMGIQTIHSVLGSGNLKKKERNEDLLLRLLIHIKNQYSTLLTPEQIKEIDAMVQSIALDSKEKEKPMHGLVSSETANSVLVGKASLPKIETHIAARSRVQFSPLLDLHTDYDEGSLPSPTRENASPLPMPKPIGFGMGTIALTQPMPPKIVEAKDDTSHVLTQPMPPKNLEAKDDALHLYDTDALKAVSSYQQKYSRNSFLASNRLPSPTPSEESDNNDDTHGEVSSSSVTDNPSIVNPGSSLQLRGFSSSGDRAASSSGFQTAPVKTVGQLGSIQNPTTKVPAKSRDPRLKFLNPEAGGSPDPNRHPMPVDPNTSGGLAGGLVSGRKHKAVDDPVLDEHILKRQRNGFMCARDVQMTTPGRGGWLDESSVVTSQPSYPVRSNENMEAETRKPGNGEIVSNKTQDASTVISGANGGIGQNPSSGADPAVLLPSIFKDIAVNPTMLMQLIKMEQQRLAAVSSGNCVSLKPPGIEQNPAGKSQLPLQTASTNSPIDVGRLRMKPRDPRRFLHSNMLQKSESLKSEPTKVNGNLLSNTVSSKDRLVVRELGEQVQTTALPSHPTSQPDITRLFTTNLKNLADIVSSSRPTNASPAPPQNSSQLIPSMVNKVDEKPVVTDCNGEKTVSSVSCEGGTTEASQTPNPWGDVDHLLDGYDDQEIAAIQKERARRIDEQNKMFAGRKLCLVLDLDHTLLNSAKFMEVDPIHDEILRKKEEQDREKPQRHLFRFQHMGMWTKLRPGIWNFLERASSLYELHLYTMGNKLYATEMAKVLDPTGALFAGRVISRGDDGDALDGDERVPKSKDLDGVLGMESAVVIIDDSVRVWPHNKLNLIVVERYTYFPYSRRQFGLLGPSLLEIDHDERPEEGTLASSLAVIERIHHNFFSHRSLNDIDVRNILAAEQRRILSGCRIVFSRIFPVGEANPHLHPLWQTAEQFGAVCTNQIDEQVTHVVANSLGTDKVNWALSTGRFVVQPGWVEASALLYRRANEHDFAIKL